MKLKNLFIAAMAMFSIAACTETPDAPYDFPNGGENNGGGTTVEGTNLLENSDFEVWENGTPTAWGQTVTNSTYSQSSDAYSGSSAVLIEGYSSSNKRFASKSYTLKAGSYTLSTYIKKSGETLGQYRLGYAKLTNGVVADTQNDYIYITSATAVPTEWKKVSCNFTLDTETEIAINIMNSKYGEGAAILIDDVTLTTTDGGLADGSEGGEEKPEAQGTTFFKETFATSLGAFTTQEVVGDFAWKFEEYNGKGYAKVSGFANSASQDAESWLVSPAFDLSGATNAYIAFDYVINKGDASAAARDHIVLMTDNYTGNVTTTEWTAIPFGAVNDNTWNFKSVSNIKVPESMIGKNKVVIAFKYVSTTANSSTWEMNNLVISGNGEAGENPGEEPETPDTPDTPANTYISEAFTNGFGSFSTQETIGNFPWVSDATYGAKASGFADGASQDAESWLISSAIDFTNETAAYIAFDYVINKGNASAAAANHKLVITNNYTGDVATTEWTEVNYGAVNNNDWNFHNTGKIALPESMMGQAAVVIAFKYMSTTANSSTWEIKNVVVASGTGNTPETPENPGEEPENPDTPDNPGEEPDTPATEGGVFDFTNPEGLTPSVKRATVEAGSTQGAGVEASEYTFTNGNVTVKVSQGSATTPVRFWTRTGGDVELRTYKSSTITVSATEGTLSSIVFEGGKVSTMTASTGSFSAGTWSGNAQSVTFSVTGTLNIQKLSAK